MKSISTYGVVFLFSFLVNCCFGQLATIQLHSTMKNDTIKLSNSLKAVPVFTFESKLDRLSTDHSTIISTIKQRSIYNVNKLPIFCKIEHKLAKSSNVNVMMRLGSLDYVNKLEGKN